jgi:hypothetical protein
LTDEKTMIFLKQLLEKNEEYPDFIRKSWKPAKRAKSERGGLQQKLA